LIKINKRPRVGKSETQKQRSAINTKHYVSPAAR
jgi:hypothetical protein